MIVFRRLRPWFLLPALLGGCEAIAVSPVAQGRTGFLSDRAFELEATIEGDAPTEVGQSRPWDPYRASSPEERVAREALVRVAQRLTLEGAPLYLERSHVEMDTWPTASKVRFQARVSGVIRDTEAPAGREAYRDRPGVHFRWPDEHAFTMRPRYEALVQEGVLRIGVVFGQMRPDGEEGEEVGLWSRRVFEEWLQSNFFEQKEPAAPGTRRWSRRADTLQIEVEVLGPESFPIQGGEEQGHAALRGVIQRSAVVYLNGHTRLPIFRPLTERESYTPRHRIVVLDTCWSYHEYTRDLLDHGGDVQVVATDGRVVTGSVGSFQVLLAGLLAGAHEPERGASWMELLAAMNDRAEERSKARAGQVEARMEPPEVYGVSPGW